MHSCIYFSKISFIEEIKSKIGFLISKSESSIIPWIVTMYSQCGRMLIQKKYGIGWVKCKVKDKNGDIKYEQYPDTRKSNDVHDQWIRTVPAYLLKRIIKLKLNGNE